MSRRSLRRVLVMATGPLNETLAGPEIRALEFAKALREDYEVTLIAQRRRACEREGMTVLPWDRRRILGQAARHDAIISPALPPYLLSAKPLLGFAAVADQYDPYELELVSLEHEDHRRELRTRAVARQLQLRQADLVLCAGARQRDALLASAAGFTRGGRTPQIDPVVIPFGIPDVPAASSRRPLREHFPQIAPDDQIVLWWGTIWRWLDATTAIRAFAKLAQTRPDVKLVITAGRPPNVNNRRFEATAEAVALARDLGVLGSSVLFLDEWIPYEERHPYLQEATLGLTLHRSSREAELAARARYMDYLTACLPCVLGRGDEAADEFEAAGYATLLDRPDPELLAATLLALLDDPRALGARRDAGRRLAAERQWSAVGRSLREALAAMPRGGEAPQRLLANLGATAGYYRRRAADELAGSLG